MTAPAPFPFWLPIVAPTLSNEHLAKWLEGTTAHKLAVLRARYGIMEFAHVHRSPLDIDWLCLLGRIEDDALGALVTERFGVRITGLLIEAMRRDLGISAFTARKAKLEHHIRELVGRFSSQNIARGWDVPLEVIEAYRMLTATEAPAHEDDALPENSRWQPEWLDLFRNHTNAQIARATGVPIDRVRAKRKQLGVAGPARRTYWKVVPEDELMASSDEGLARKYGGPLSDYAAQRLTVILKREGLTQRMMELGRLPDILLRFLGVISVRRLAAITGLSEAQLRRQHHDLGIALYSAKSASMDSMLGRAPDKTVAEVFHVSPSTVKNRRDALGIPAFKSRSKREAPELNLEGQASEQSLSANPIPKKPRKKASARASDKHS